VLAFVLLIPFLAFVVGHRRRGRPWRQSVLVAATAWGVFVTAITEGLSLFRALTLPAMLGVWLGTGVVACLLATRGAAMPRRELSPLPEGPERPRERWLLVPLSGIVVALGVLGMATAPNTYDSMTYHLSRVVHWVQNASVAPYPTHILRQIYQTPWAEYALLQVQVMCGGDRCAHLVQWLAMVGSVAGVSWIARQLGAGPRGQIFAAVLCATIPLGLLQAASTQNDYVLAFWLVCLVTCALAVVSDPREQHDWLSVTTGGAALGLALLTKGTGYLLALPFVLWLGLGLWRRHGKRAIPMGLLIAGLALAINAGHYWRNVDVFGSPLGPGPGPGVPYFYSNRVFSAGATASNVLRNLAVEVGTPSWPVNVRLERSVRAVHAWLGLDPDDPRTTFVGERFIILAHLWNSENVAANLVHTLLILATVGTVLASRASRRPPLVAYLGALTFAFGLLCFYVAWTPWNTRLLLPLSVLWCAAIGTVMERSWGRSIAATLTVGLLLSSLAWIVASVAHPLLGPRSVWHLPRNDQYFLRNPAVRRSFLEAAALMRQRRCERIGLVMGWNDIEYPLWVLFRDGGSRPHVVHVNVDNASARTGEGAAFLPCLVVSVDGPRVRVEARD